MNEWGDKMRKYLKTNEGKMATEEWFHDNLILIIRYYLV
jgi:hypothetical protein